MHVMQLALHKKHRNKGSKNLSHKKSRDVGMMHCISETIGSCMEEPTGTFIQCKLYINIPTGTKSSIVGAGCSNQMQVAQGQSPVRVCAQVQTAIGFCILFVLSIVPKMVLTLSYFGWWCSSCHQIAQTSHLHLQ